jgi:phosphate/sulfate permease
MSESLNSLLTLYGTVCTEVGHFFSGVGSISNSSHVWTLFFCLFLAYAFEFVNGFHDTANAVATVIYTRSLKPWPAVIWAGFCNFIGVFVGGTVVAMAIVKLIPTDLIMSADVHMSMTFVASLLIAAVVWNLGTWYFGIPASSSHTLIGSILGIGIGHSLMKTGSIMSGVNWSKAADVGLALLLSPLIGFGLAALVLMASKKFLKDAKFHKEPSKKSTPPWRIRSLLIATSTGVSFAHGSNDGQKGVGLVMLILIALMPAQYALRPDAHLSELRATISIAESLPRLLEESYIATVKQKTPNKASISINVGLIKEVVASEKASKADL